MKILQYILSALLIGVVIINLTQRKHLSHGERKRLATLYLAGFAAVIYGVFIIIRRYYLPLPLLLIPIVLGAVLIWLQRRHFPFTLKCVSCGVPLSLKRILYYDSNLCEQCDESEEENEKQS